MIPTLLLAAAQEESFADETRRDSLLLGRRRDFLVLEALDGSGAEFGLALAAAE